MGKLIGIMASTPEGGIASNGKLPWNRPPDGKWFSQVTRDRTVIMGRKTFEEIVMMSGGPLLHRNNAVLTSSDLTGLLLKTKVWKTEVGVDNMPVVTLTDPQRGMDNYSITVPVDGDVEGWLDHLINESDKTVFVIGGLDTLRVISEYYIMDEFWHTVATVPTDHEPDTFLELPGWDFKDTSCEKLYEPSHGKYVVYRRKSIKVDLQEPVVTPIDEKLLDKLTMKPEYRWTNPTSYVSQITRKVHDIRPSSGLPTYIPDMELEKSDHQVALSILDADLFRTVAVAGTVDDIKSTQATDLNNNPLTLTQITMNRPSSHVISKLYCRKSPTMELVLIPHIEHVGEPHIVSTLMDITTLVKKGDTLYHPQIDLI